MYLTYLVLSARDLQVTKMFYEALGLVFVEEKHGKGPVHFAATLSQGIVVELYPGTSLQEDLFAEPRRSGWVIEDREVVFGRLAQAGYMPFIRRDGSVCVRDPDGRLVELLEKTP